VLEWLSDNRATVAAWLIIGILIAFVVSISIGKRESKRRAKDEVFGDPQRTRGGWYWALCGVCTLLLVWFYFSWGVGRAYFPNAANDMCQIAKLEEAVSPIAASLPLESRYYKSTLLVSRNITQLAKLETSLPVTVFTDAEQAELVDLIAKTAEEALAQPKWGVTNTEIPILPVTPRGVLFDQVSQKAEPIAAAFVKVRNKIPSNDALIEDIKTRINALNDANEAGDFDAQTAEARNAYIKAVDRIFKRLDDGTIFPAESMQIVNSAMMDLHDAKNDARGTLGVVDALFFPGPGVVKSKTQCTEQGSARWLPKPTDVVATFAQLANPDVENGGGYRGFPLLWWKWLPVADVVGFLTPDWIADLWPGEYASHGSDGSIEPNTKDKILAFAQGETNLGHIPMLDGHIWDSLFRVLVALALGIVLGVPLGLFMGVSKFFKSFFDPLIELYRPVPPLAWAPLILTIFGIKDDGKIFLLFMVAFAIMVISARTGASGTQLSKIRAAHSLGSTDRQIMWNVIFPNALPEILTGIRIAIGVCWGTLVAAEMLAGTTGVGFIENIARTVSDYELIWVTDAMGYWKNDSMAWQRIVCAT